ncbi:MULTISPECIES: ShlB/FhaC/HecB family hemolysin secretion/activation protein [unclassified Tolypothrix]|uniref:ShlB/FhaC/HecB family hemolysin secretion/activation protein n=1 Tax=unclassified Tolypothrix TaxID=2649714 RepID=UPI0009DB6359|nr:MULTISPECIES: ShlB/FhaC/HecB family hemolysin secretion/activation protein [unclassified Tolypothrix]MBE9081204.1 ShlB/FhaC/HecB family hemolysin secretion/activation protein [Tolypothrix sp. LEGE 11397]UYD29947.1 ShlB/FhaC/HecB family hemolysin secretion/activation protein [Tolypothrix sp. PCC 7712]UYD37605.1 ShlB/FhaC/HecB family hemolysin secretion/activation protein [Tolypothrix sp. PCC 7601]
MSDKLLHKYGVLLLQLSIFVLLANINAKSAKAQTINSSQISNINSIQAQQLPPPQDVQPPVPSPTPLPKPPQPLPPPEQLLPAPNPTPVPEQTLPENLPENIVVERFEVVGSTVFTPEQLAAETKEFIKRPISLAEIFQARSKITDLYVRNGYITSGAYIPPQTIKSGVIKIQVVEGKLEEIQVTGTRRLNSNYVRSRLAIATKAPLNREQLLEALQLLQLNPLIQNLSAELSAGSRPGVSVLQVEVREAQSFSAQVVLDNGRSPSVGSFRRRLQINQANLLGFGDGFNFAYTNTDGSNAFDVGYTLPLNARNGTLSFNFGTTSSNVIEEPFNILDIESSSRYYEITFRQPIIQTPTQELALGLTASRRESEATYIEGERLPFPSLGADEQGRTRISAIRFFQEWTTRNSREVIALRSQFNLGIGAFDATINQDGPDSRFFAWQGQAQWARLLAPETLLLLRVNTQLASKSLLPLEQLGLGGIDTVRGYRQDYLLTDNGAFASAEVQVPILRLPKIGSTLHLAPFVDFGVAWNNSNRANPDPNTLASVGLGLRWTQGDRFTARLDWGVPLVSVESRENTWQENGLYFSLIYNPF